MATADYLRQTGKPLFPDILWNRPVNRRAGGQLLIIGGHRGGFARVQAAYQSALAAGVGSAKVIMPSALRSGIGELPEGLFVPSTPSGSLAKQALGDLLAASREVDTVLLPGDLSANPETIALLEQFISEVTVPLVIAGDVIKSLGHNPGCLARASVLIAGPATFSELARRLKIPAHVQKPDLQKELRLLDALHEKLQIALVLPSDDRIIVRYDTQASLTQVDSDVTPLSARCATYYLQHPGKPFEALTTAVWQIS